MKYKSAVIGCGRIGCSFGDDKKRKNTSTHAGAYKATKETELVALVDTDSDKLKICAKRFGYPMTYFGHREMIIEEQPNIVSICTPPDTHFEIIKNIVEFNCIKAIFCEKPLADNLYDARKIIELCKKNNILLVVDHQRRFDKFFKAVKTAIDAGDFGEIQQTSFYYTAGILNTGTHMFDLLQYFFGDVDWVYAVNSKNKYPAASDINLDGLLKFESGLLCSIQACDAREYAIFELDIIGTKARMQIMNSGFNYNFYKVFDNVHFGGYKELRRSDILLPQFENSICDGVEHIINCLSGKEKNISSGEDAIKSLELIEEFKFSAVTGEKIKMK